MGQSCILHIGTVLSGCAGVHGLWVGSTIFAAKSEPQMSLSAVSSPGTMHGALKALLSCIATREGTSVYGGDWHLENFHIGNYCGQLAGKQGCFSVPEINKHD